MDKFYYILSGEKDELNASPYKNHCITSPQQVTSCRDSSNKGFFPSTWMKQQNS